MSAQQPAGEASSVVGTKTPAASRTAKTRRRSGPLSRRRALTARRANAEKRRNRWFRTFSRYLPFTGWRVPVAVESAIQRFLRRFGGESRGSVANAAALPISGRTSRLRIDFDRGIWRTSSLEQFEKKMLLSISVGHIDEGYVDDSWVNVSEGQAVVWQTAAGEEVPLVYGYDAFSSLADGVAATNEGGILNIAEGSYSEILATQGKGLTIRTGGDRAEEVSIDGLSLGATDTLDFDILGIDSHDRLSLAAGASVFEMGAARLNVNDSAGPADTADHRLC